MDKIESLLVSKEIEAKKRSCSVRDATYIHENTNDPHFPSLEFSMIQWTANKVEPKQNKLCLFQFLTFSFSCSPCSFVHALALKEDLHRQLLLLLEEYLQSTHAAFELKLVRRRAHNLFASAEIRSHCPMQTTPHHVQLHLTKHFSVLQVALLCCRFIFIVCIKYFHFYFWFIFADRCWRFEFEFWTVCRCLCHDHFHNF